MPTEKDLQIALLRQQLRMLERNSTTKPRLAHPEKLMLVTLATRLKAQTQRFYEALDEAIWLIQLDIVRITRENPRMRYDKIQGELLKLGFNVHPTTVKNVLRRHGFLPAPLQGRTS